MNLFIEIFSTSILVIAEIIFWKNISVSNIKNRKGLFILATLIMVIGHILNFHFASNFIKSITIMLISVLCCKMLLKTSWKESIILSFLCEIVIILLEAIILIVAYLFFKLDVNNIDIKVSYLVNIIIAIALYMVSYLRWIQRIYNFIRKSTLHIKNIEILLFLLFVMLGTSMVFASIYFNGKVVVIAIANIITTILYTTVVILVFNYQNRYHKTNLKYNTSLENLQIQESIINDYRLINHENKNNLLTIKSMTNNKKVITYINSLLKQNKKISNKMINETLKIPKGGIRGLIYSKLMLIKEKDIKYFLEVDKKINSKILSNISDDDTVNICQILGVFIDNAIDETQSTKKGEINISLHLFENNLVVTISNYHEQYFDLNKSVKTLNSTKGLNHGYGLQLVKKIIDSNNKLSNERIIDKNIFTQKLIIRL